MNTFAEMPKYRCHKEVWALKIKEIRQTQPAWTRPTCKGAAALGTACGHCERCEWLRRNPNLGLTLVFEDQGYLPIDIDVEFVRKHNPQPGGYYVVYEDGYRSFSPASAFEKGYTRI